jgi:hypothetical protein
MFNELAAAVAMNLCHTAPLSSWKEIGRPELHLHSARQRLAIANWQLALGP